MSDLLGRFRLFTEEETSRVRIEREGFTSVERMVRVAEAQGTGVLDARLRPLDLTDRTGGEAVPVNLIEWNAESGRLICTVPKPSRVRLMLGRRETGWLLGNLVDLVQTHCGDIHPNSMVLTPSGTVYVGMRLFVGQLVPTGDEWVERWLVSDECTRFRMDEERAECICIGGDKKDQ